MKEKVIHVSDEAHAAAKAYCARNRFHMSTWVCRLIERAIADASSEPVKKKQKLPRLDESNTGTDDPYKKPPFWEEPVTEEVEVPEPEPPEHQDGEEADVHQFGM